MEKGRGFGLEMGVDGRWSKGTGIDIWYWHLLAGLVELIVSGFEWRWVVGGGWWVRGKR